MTFSEGTRDKFRRVAASYQLPLVAFEAAIEAVAPDIIADNHREVASAGGKARFHGMTPLERRAATLIPRYSVLYRTDPAQAQEFLNQWFAQESAEILRSWSKKKWYRDLIGQ
jgi:hypothetical protein